MEAQASILIVDDEAVVRRVFGDALAQAGYRVRLAESGEAALAALAVAPAELVLLDLQLGDSDGIEVMRAARERWPQLQIIILTAHGSMASAIEALRADVADYLLKPVSVEALRTRVAEVLARNRTNRERTERLRSMSQQLQAMLNADEMPPAPAKPTLAGERVLRAGPLVLDIGRHSLHMDGQSIEVTPTEFAILHALLHSAGAVVTCGQLAQGFQSGVVDEDEARQIMRPHIVRLRRKLEPDPARPAYLQSVRGVGYRWNSNGIAQSDE